MAGEKRSQDNEESIINENVIIIDIEGTTTSISFVKDNLFPYVRENVKKYIDSKWEDNEFKKVLDKLKEQAKKDEEDKTEGVVPISGSTVDEEKESLVKNVLWQMDGDRKSGALKQLQGHIWREAYDSGKIKGHVYEDVPESLKSWKNIGKKVYVYSSGSVEAQKLLFGHTEHGDLLEYFSGHFDTAVGPKQEAESYKNILKEIKAEASDVIFLTDIVQEAKAAKEAGLSTIVMIREGNAPLTADEIVEFKTAKSFLDLSFMNPAKRPKLETPEDSDKPKTVDTVTEKIEVSNDVEMTDVSDKDSKSNVDTNETAKPSETESTNDVVADEKTKATETVAEKDEAMETDGKTVEANKEIEETKTVEDEPKKETEDKIEAEVKVDKSKADETNVEVKETEVKEKKDEKVEAEVEIETKTVEEDKTETSKNDKIENQTETKKSLDVEETKNETKKTENLVAEEEKESEKTKQKLEEPKENGTSKLDDKKKTDTEVVVSAETKSSTTDENIDNKDEGTKNKVEETKEEKESENKVVDVVEPEVKKLNGTTQNGNDSSKIHTNGVNEPCTSDKDKDKDTTSNTNVINKITESVSVSSQQHESSTNETITDSIKVKKVVESTTTVTAADGAVEKDVVTPSVAVAATS